MPAILGTFSQLMEAIYLGSVRRMRLFRQALLGQPTQQEFAPTAGVLNRCSQSGFYSFIPATHRTGVLASGDYEVTPSLKLFSEALYSRVQQYEELPPPQFYGVPGYQQFKVPASNPYNPFGKTVGVSELLTTLDFSAPLYTDFFRALLGARGHFLKGWDWEIAGWDSHDRSSNTYTNTLSAAGVQNALNSTDPSTALNPFVAGQPGSAALLKALTFDQLTRYSGETLMANAFVRGSLIQLPSGAVQIVLGSEYGRDKLYFNNISDPFIARGSTNKLRSQTAMRIFGESRVPIFAHHASPQAGSIVAVTLAGRYDSYSDFGHKITPQFGAELRPSDALLIRGTYAKAFKAPSLYELYSPRQQLPDVSCGSTKPRPKTDCDLSIRWQSGSETGSRAVAYRWSRLFQHCDSPSPIVRHLLGSAGEQQHSADWRTDDR